ncbi:MAG TPA: hypothetical protein VHB20_11615 [Verrucomicrobiae bacterium]|jgi:sugar lactone lactonase YvrE|nr:hypothetical protein [Verrucomicrobiae bacterium]
MPQLNVRRGAAWLSLLWCSLLASSAPAAQTGLNAGFSAWAAQYAAAPDSATRAALVPQGLAAARQRHVALSGLIKTDPADALAVSDSLPRAAFWPAEITGELETRFAAVGDYVVMGAVPAQGGPAVTPVQRTARISGQTFAAYVYGKRLGETTKLGVPLQGIALDGTAALADAPLDESPNPPSAWTTGAKKILIIRVDFSDRTGDPEGLTAAAVQNVADNQIAPYYARSSYGLTTVTNIVTPTVYRLPHTAQYYAVNGANDSLHSDAEVAAGANYIVTAYDRVIVFFSSLGNIASSQITYGGLADIGASRVWCNGEFDFRVIAHEVGHTYGLFHANLWQVSDANPISASGTDVEYGDDFDTMGANGNNNLSTDFNVWFKNILGWVGDSQIQTVTSNGTYRVFAFDRGNYVAAPGETLALKVVKDSTHNYWISCRRDFTNNTAMENGAYVFWGYNYTRQSDLLDLTTSGVSDQDAPLAVGGIFTDVAVGNGVGVTIHPVAKGGVSPNEYRDIQVIFGVAPPLAPNFIVQPVSQTALLGQSVSFLALASGNPPPAYQWQRKASGSSVWVGLTDGGSYSGSATTNLVVAATDLAMNGDQFQCVASNSAGQSTNATPVSLSVQSALTVTTLAGQFGAPGEGDGLGTNAQFFYPYDVAADGQGNVYVTQFYNGVIRKIDRTGMVSTIAYGFYGVEGIALDPGGNLWVADSYNQAVQRVTPDGNVTLIAGALQVSGSSDGTNGDALFNRPWGIAVDSATNVFVADSGNQTIRMLKRVGSAEDWAVTTIAGLTGAAGSVDGTNDQARFKSPASVAVDAAGNIFVADSGNNSIRKITHVGAGTNWVVKTISGQAGVSGDRNGVGTNSLYYSPSGIAVDGAGNLFVADTYNDLIREISPQGVATTLAGSYFATGGTDGFNTAALFNGPYGIDVDGGGNIYVADTYNHTVRVGHYATVIIPGLNATPSDQQAVLSWPVPTQPYHLQTSPDLRHGDWAPVTDIPTVINSRFYLTNSDAAGAAFFRLVNP